MACGRSPGTSRPGREFDPRKLPSDQFFPPAANLPTRRLPSRTEPTMSALRILVPVKRVIDYAVGVPALHEPRVQNYLGEDPETPATVSRDRTRAPNSRSAADHARCRSSPASTRPSRASRRRA